MQESNQPMNGTRRTSGSLGRCDALAIISALAMLAGNAVAIGQSPPTSNGTPLPLPAAVPIFPAGPAYDYQVLGAVKGVVSKLKQNYAGRTDVQFSEASGKLLVIGPDQVHQEVSQWLKNEGLLPPATPPTQKPVVYTEPQSVQTQTWHLKNLSARDFESKLAKTWGTSLQSSQDTAGDVATFRFPPSAAGSTSIIVDRRANTATVASPPNSAPSWQRLMGVLDSRPRSGSEKTAIFPVSKSDPATLRRAVSLLTQIFGGADSHRKQHIGHFVSMLFQPDAGAVAQVAQQPGGQAPAPTAPVAPPAGAPMGGGADVTSQAITPGSASAASM